MYTQADKNQENKAADNAVAQKQNSSKQGSKLTDNRPEAVAQRKLQEIANNSPQVKQLKAYQQMADSRSAVAQRLGIEGEEPLQAKSVDDKEAGKSSFPGIKAGIEALSGTSLDNVRVDHSASKPPLLHARSYAQGVAPHVNQDHDDLLQHEVTHTVQRVKDDGKMEKIKNVPDFYKPINTELGAIAKTRHHIVPKDILMNFYNTAHGCGDLDALKGVMKSIATNSLETYGFAGVTFEQFSAAKAARLPDAPAATVEDWEDTGGRSKAKIHGEIDNLSAKEGGKHKVPVDKTAAELIEKMYQWFPGNLIIGPGGRKDDPGSGFEVNADKLLPADAFLNLKTMCEKMQLYIAKKGSPAERAVALAAVIPCLTTAIGKTEPYAYDADKWDLTAETGPRIKPA
jgi:hypothetical protein